ncbi:hypothetical protein BAUCODRAFT_118711 [Baudoinia panamericana UAMH 10762]|uniref:Uncharacterized protein n=1 Tax=Baudoinia panamericana (strain UAMH 10762) TaxID=717646 RepID=M2N9Y3_BAUPA|nr:uncharacterized protein BAUCODRAFT_118711 [Baudoinia panamericana UAMH 10762]EMD00994.1 hypothetical protein BAUCODRAFT_118711 [Baudoinia panamericana UAMH 10762]
MPLPEEPHLCRYFTTWCFRRANDNSQNCSVSRRLQEHLELVWSLRADMLVQKQLYATSHSRYNSWQFHGLPTVSKSAQSTSQPSAGPPLQARTLRLIVHRAWCFNNYTMLDRKHL